MASSLRESAAPAAPGRRYTPALIGLQDGVREFPVRPSMVLQTSLLLLIVGNLVRIPIWSSASGRGVPVLVSDLTVGALFLVGIATAVHRRSLKLDAIALVGAAFAMLGLISALAAVPRFGLSMTELAVAIAQLVRWVIYFGVYVIAVNTVAKRDVVPVWKALETAALVFAGFGVLQSAFLPDFAQLVYPESRAYQDWDIQGHRLVSTILDPNFAGAFVMLVLLVQIALMASGAKVEKWRPLLLFVALILTASRGSILAFVVGVGIIVLVRGRSKKLLSLITVSAVLVAAALPKIITYARSFNKLGVADASALARLINWAHAWTVFRDHPIIGVGFNTWSVIQSRYGWEQSSAGVFGLDGGIIFIAVLTGVIGAALYIAMFVLMFRRARRVWRNGEAPSFDRGLALGAAAASIALVVHSLFTNSLLLPFLMEPLWVLWALAFVVAGAVPERPKVAAPASVALSRF